VTSIATYFKTCYYTISLGHTSKASKHSDQLNCIKQLDQFHCKSEMNVADEIWTKNKIWTVIIKINNNTASMWWRIYAHVSAHTITWLTHMTNTT